MVLLIEQLVNRASLFVTWSISLNTFLHELPAGQPIRKPCSEFRFCYGLTIQKIIEEIVN
jgi:hypothetical protein